ncbi:MAG: DUF4349 domain-containing protein, partial [Armatimonadetes bacterium]|nr:DUF4349 domain-containing protein [Armatimonadota bacterium]
MKRTGMSDKLLFTTVALVTLLALTAMFGGCGLLAKREKMHGGTISALSSGGDYEMPQEVESAPGDEMRMAEAPSSPASDVDTTGDTSATLDIMASAAAAENRKVIKTADLNIEVENITDAQKRVQDLVESAGGFIADMEVQNYDTRTEASITARVPSAKFREVYDAVKQLGDVKRDHVGGQDVTEEY